MIYFLSSILILTVVFSLLYNARIISFCPICAGVVITWFAGIIGLYTNQSWADPFLIAILLGASLGALADKYGSKFGLVWKTLIALLGLPAIYYIVQQKLWLGLGFVAVLIVLTFLSSRNKANANQPGKDLFKECC